MKGKSLKDKLQRNTKQRELVLNAVQARRDHPSADDIYLELLEKSPDISKGTVYRNLRLLSKKGQVRQIELSDKARFDWREEPHYHLRCSKCGTLSDAAIDYDAALDRLLSESSGYLITHHHTVFEGLCPHCR